MSRKRKDDKGIVHEATVDWLVNRLLASGKFDKVSKDIPYNVHGINGQIDVLGVIGKNLYFYEVKSSYSDKNVRKATHQYQRYKGCHRNQTLEGYIVTPNRIERLRL